MSTSNQSYRLGAAQMQDSCQRTVSQRLLPLVRLCPAYKAIAVDGFYDVLVIASSELAIFRVKRRHAPPISIYQDSEHPNLRDVRSVGPVTRLLLASINLVEIGETKKFGNLVLGNVCWAREIRIQAGDNTFACLIREKDAGHVLRVLSELLGESRVHSVSIFAPNKVDWPRPTVWRWLCRLALLLFLLRESFIGVMAPGPGGIPAAIAMFLIATLLMLALMVLFLLHLSRSVRSRESRLPQRSVGSGGLPGHTPWHSRRAGLLLKTVGVLFFIFSASPGGPQIVFDLFGIRKLALESSLIMLMPLLLNPLSILLVYLGYRFSLSPAVMAEEDKTPGTLYLRSFLDDGRTSFNPQNLWTVGLGIEPFPFVRGVLGWTANYHPIRFVRLLFGNATDTAEEQLATFFRKRGRFVALGQPGEHLLRGGATLVFVDDAHWQDIVEPMISQAQLVVLQPAETSAIRWELAQCLRILPPERLLLCLVNYVGAPQRYEEFKLEIEAVLPVELPRHQLRSHFLYFAADWSPRLLPLQYSSPLRWPLAGHCVDFSKTLSPFFQCAEMAIDPRRNLLTKNRFPVWGAIVSIILWFFPVIALLAFVGLAPMAAIRPGWLELHLQTPLSAEGEEAVRRASRIYSEASSITSWKVEEPPSGFKAMFRSVDGHATLGLIEGPSVNRGIDKGQSIVSLRESILESIAKQARTTPLVIHESSRRFVGKRWQMMLLHLKSEKEDRVFIFCYRDDSESMAALFFVADTAARPYLREGDAVFLRGADTRIQTELTDMLDKQDGYIERVAKKAL